MRITIAGCGAMGLYYGACLVRSGARVRFLATERTRRAIEANGIILREHDIDYRIAQPHVESDPSAMTRADLVLLTTKAMAVPCIGPALAYILDEHGFVLTTQNGVDAPEIVARHVGDDRVLGAACRLIVERVDRHTVVHRSVPPSMRVGSWAARAEPSCLDALRTAGVEIEWTGNIRAELWRKLAFVSSVGVMGAITRGTLGAYRDTASGRPTLAALVGEACAVAHASGVGITDPDREAEDIMAFIDTLSADATFSMQRDLEAGRESELDAQLGEIVRRGHTLRVRVPVSQRCLRTLESNPREVTP